LEGRKEGIGVRLAGILPLVILKPNSKGVGYSGILIRHLLKGLDWKKLGIIKGWIRQKKEGWFGGFHWALGNSFLKISRRMDHRLVRWRRIRLGTLVKLLKRCKRLLKGV